MIELFSTEHLGLFTLLLLIIGFIKFIVYYKSFNVPIIEYIEPSEVITLFTDNLITAIGTSLLLVWPYASIIIKIDKMGSTLSTYDLLFQYISTITNYLIYFSFILTIAFLILKISTKIKTFELYIYLIFSPILLLCIPFIIILLSRNLLNISDKEEIILSIIISTVAMVGVARFTEIRKVKLHSYYKNIIVYFDNESLISNQDFYYVGKTKNFIFFYSSKEHKSSAYSTKNLKCISYEFTK